MQSTFFIKAFWDKNAKVYHSQSDIHGLIIEAASLKEFEELIREMAVEIIIANHRTASDLASKSMKELMPVIIWQRPGSTAVA